MTGMDLQQELERAIGDGPALPSAGERLAAGRRRLRRRRAGVAAAAAAAVVAVVVPVAALAGGALTSGVDPLGTPSATQDAVPGVEEPWRDTYARYTQHGDLEIRPGATVLDRVDGYLDGTRWTRSVALELRHEGVVRWVTAEWRRGQSSSGWTEPGGDWTDFYEWVVDEASNYGGDGGRAVGLLWDGDGLVASSDTEILEQRRDVDLGPRVAAESEQTGAALVEIEGERMLVLYRQAPGEEGQLLAVLRNDDARTLDELVAWAREHYESGKGVL